MLLYQVSASAIHEKNIKSSYKNNKFKILSDGSYSVSDIQDCFEYISKKNETLTDKPPIKTYVNKIENRITLKIKTRNYLKLLMPETIKLNGNTKNKKTKDENGKNVPHLKITEIVHRNILSDDY